MTPTNLGDARQQYQGLAPIRIVQPDAATIPFNLPEQLSLNEALLLIARDYEAEAEFTYVKADGSSVETRRVIPEALTFTKDNVLLVTGHDDDRNDIRAFRADRIRGTVTVRL